MNVPNWRRRDRKVGWRMASEHKSHKMLPGYAQIHLEDPSAYIKEGSATI